MLGGYSLEVPKCFLLVGTLHPRGQLFGEVQERVIDIREEGDELPVEVAKSEEKPYGLDDFRVGLFPDGLEFDQIHLYYFLPYYHPQILHFFS